MQAIEIQADVDQNHEVHFTLPESWQANKVKLIVLEAIEPQKENINEMKVEIEKINQCAEQLNQEMDDASAYQIAL